MTVPPAPPGEDRPRPTHLASCDCESGDDAKCVREAEMLVVDGEIARLRGWTHDATDGWTLAGRGRMPSLLDDGLVADRAWQASRDAACQFAKLTRPPPFSADWTLAGPLLEQVGGRLALDESRSEWVCDLQAGYIPSWDDSPEAQRGATPCEAIALAWLAWRQERP